MKLINVLAHRGNIEGPESKLENTAAKCRGAMAAGFGLEIDLRRSALGEFYISHDPAPPTSDSRLEKFEPMFRKHSDLVVAVNVKELGYEEELARLMEQGVFGRRSFYFDFEFLEPQDRGRSQRKILSSLGGAANRLAGRLSDRGDDIEHCLSIPAEVVWADEFDSLWLKAEHIEILRKNRRQVYVISPELHGFSTEERYERWADFREWGVDGICTDYSLEAKLFFQQT